MTGLALVAGLAAAAVYGQDEDMIEPLVVTGDGASDTEVEPSASDSSESTDTSTEEASSDGSIPGVKAEDTEEQKIEKELRRLRSERDLLSMRNAIRAEEVKAEIAAMREEKDRLALENSLVMERVRAELIEQKSEIDRLAASVEEINSQVSLETAKARQEMHSQLADLRRRDEELSLQNSLMQKESSVEMERLRLAETKLKLRRTELETEFAELQARISIRDKADEVRDRVLASGDPEYLMDPMVDGVLRISDRRIALNGPIWAGVSSHVSERINYFNNQSTEYPIFLVIDSSPGGSVWAGYRILRAIEGSKAPVYVVVKSYAASMAAIITALAERSYAYPNAIILHHELSWYGVVGNLSQQSEYAESAKEWWRRLAEPVAAKMGVTLPEFRALMYERSSVGDWQEFADVAQKYNWVDQIVDRMWETSIEKNPDRYGMQFWAEHGGLDELRDDKGRAYVELPRLEPHDFYFLYDPSGYYRIPR